MGNNNSQSPQPSSQQDRQWSNSYPREPGRHKVLPERIPGQRLRVTDNGAILQNGGTISGRRQTLPANLHCKKDEQLGNHLYHSRVASSQSNQHQKRDGLSLRGKRFGSEPDLRFPRDHGHESPAKQRISRSRKKYKAPAPPPGTESHGPDSSSPDSFHWELDPPRRMRLFKTRAESKKHQAEHKGTESPLMKHHSPLSPKPLQRSLSSPEFQAELLKAAQRLRPLSSVAPPVTPPPPRHLREHVPPPPPIEEAITHNTRPESKSGLSAPHDDQPAPQLPPRRKPVPIQNKSNKKHWEIIPSPTRKERDVPAKTFYFGMEQGEREAVERFAASLQQQSAAMNDATPTTASSSLSSEEESDEYGGNRGGIALRLRPTLPKKQLEIPRFSPTAAWRLLSSLDAHHPASVTTTMDEGPVLLEECIQHLSRPVAPPQLPIVNQAPRSSHEKSGDSGISGDASPGGVPEDSEALAVQHKIVPQHAWTPQQDLEGEESSSDGGVDTLHATQQTGTRLALQPKFSPRSHVFSLSLPRDDRLCLALYADNENLINPKMKFQRDIQPSFNSLKKLKRSMLGSPTGGQHEDERAEALDENWVLSRSVPVLPQHPPSSSTTSPSSPDFSYLAMGGHVMYLPQYSPIDTDNDIFPRGRSYSGGLKMSNLHSTSHLSKSCDNISASEMRQIGRTPSPELMDIRGRRSRGNTSPRPVRMVQNNEEIKQEDNANRKRSKPKRFTFQSTVRQIERRRLAERLSKEAELKERQRLSELEAMRQVEEEFQRKRAREKANIRQQLRLFSMDENLYSSLPADWNDGMRAEPDGAPSSSPASQSSAHNGANRQITAGCSDLKTQSTQVLSEFREPRREYREYRQSRYIDSGPESLSHLENKRAMVHPKVVYDIPKNTQVYITSHQANGGPGVEQDRSTPRSDNYRRDFAHGALPPGRSITSSDSELSQGNTRHMHLQHHRSRSVSPDIQNESSSCGPESATAGEKEDLISVTVANEVKPVAAVTIQDSPPPAVEGSRFLFNSIQPFVRNRKVYRPIVFNPGSSPSHKVAQTVS